MQSCKYNNSFLADRHHKRWFTEKCCKKKLIKRANYREVMPADVMPKENFIDCIEKFCLYI